MTDWMFYVVSVARIPDAARRDVPLKHDREDGEAVQPQDKRTALNDRSPNAWLFQSNPVLYDLRGALCSLKEQVWSVSRYANKIRVGDRIYLWEAGRLGGIVGLAQISECARMQPEPPEQRRFARVAEAFAMDRVRARLRITRVIEPVITRQAIVSCPELNALSVLRCARGTNFLLRPEEWKALDGLIQNSAPKHDYRSAFRSGHTAKCHRSRSGKSPLVQPRD